MPCWDVETLVICWIFIAITLTFSWIVFFCHTSPLTSSPTMAIMLMAYILFPVLDAIEICILVLFSGFNDTGAIQHIDSKWFIHCHFVHHLLYPLQPSCFIPSLPPQQVHFRLSTCCLKYLTFAMPLWIRGTSLTCRIVYSVWCASCSHSDRDHLSLSLSLGICSWLFE